MALQCEKMYCSLQCLLKKGTIKGNNKREQQKGAIKGNNKRELIVQIVPLQKLLFD